MLDSKILVSPYETTYGKKLTHTEKIEKALMEYIITNKDMYPDYEFEITDDLKRPMLFFITGYNQEERELPVWEHPLVFKDARGRFHVAVDLRKYTKQLTSQPETISDNLKDIAGGMFLINRGIFTAEFVNGNLGLFRPFLKPITISLAMLVSTAIMAGIGLNPTEKIDTEIVVGHYANVCMLNGYEIEENLDIIKARLTNCKFSLPVTATKVSAVMQNLNNDVKDIAGLIENIRTVLPAGKHQLLTSDILVNLMSNLWYGPGGSAAVMMGLEHMPTWLALITAGISDKSYKKNRLATTLDKFSRQIGFSDFEKSMNDFLKQRRK